MEMMQDIRINGVSARSLGLIVDPLSPPPMAAQRYATYAVGGDQDMSVPDDSFDDIAYPVTLRIAGEPERFDNSALYALLHGAQQLKISQLPRYFFRIKRISGITPTARLRGNEFTYNLTFTLSPFKYIDAEPTVEPDRRRRGHKPRHKILQTGLHADNVSEQRAGDAHRQRQTGHDHNPGG